MKNINSSKTFSVRCQSDWKLFYLLCKVLFFKYNFVLRLSNHKSQSVSTCCKKEIKKIYCKTSYSYYGCRKVRVSWDAPTPTALGGGSTGGPAHSLQPSGLACYVFRNQTGPLTLKLKLTLWIWLKSCYVTANFNYSKSAFE